MSITGGQPMSEITKLYENAGIEVPTIRLKNIQR